MSDRILNEIDSRLRAFVMKYGVQPTHVALGHHTLRRAVDEGRVYMRWEGDTDVPATGHYIFGMRVVEICTESEYIGVGHFSTEVMSARGDQHEKGERT